MLRDRDGENLREHLISTAARLLDQRGSAGLAVRDIAREAQVADGALYNYFEDKEDLLAQALLHHVGTVMNETPGMPEAGTGSVAENLTVFIDRGMESLYRVVPAFAGLMSQPNVLRRFHAMVGGDAAFAAPAGGEQDAGRRAGPRGPRATRAPQPPRDPAPVPAGRTAAGPDRRGGRPGRRHLADRGRDPRPGAAPGPVRAARQPAPHPARPRGATRHDRPARPGAPRAPPPYLNATALKNV